MLNPPFTKKYSRNSRSPATTKGGTIYYPIWLSYATGVLEKEGFNVKLLDAPARNHNLSFVIKFVKKFKPDLIIIDTSTPSIFNDVKVAGTIKDKIKTKREIETLRNGLASYSNALMNEIAIPIMEKEKKKGKTNKENAKILNEKYKELGLQ